MKPKRHHRNRLWKRHEMLQKEVAELSAKAQEEYEANRAVLLSEQESAPLASTTSSTREYSSDNMSDSSSGNSGSFSVSISDSEDDINICSGNDHKSCTVALENHQRKDDTSTKHNDTGKSVDYCKLSFALLEIQEATKRELVPVKEAISRIKNSLQLSTTSRGVVRENDIVKKEDKFIG